MRLLYKTALVLVIFGHLYVVITNIIAFFILPFLCKFYVSCPLMTFIVFVSFSRQPCPITNLENAIRRKLGMREIKGFIGHYLINPLKDSKIYVRDQSLDSDK